MAADRRESVRLSVEEHICSRTPNVACWNGTVLTDSFVCFSPHPAMMRDDFTAHSVGALLDAVTVNFKFNYCCYRRCVKILVDDFETNLEMKIVLVNVRMHCRFSW